MNYQETGLLLPVKINELITYIHKQLEDYDMQKLNGIDSNYSPYLHPIIYKTKDNFTVKIPENVKIYAISLWKKQKLIPNNEINNQINQNNNKINNQINNHILNNQNADKLNQKEMSNNYNLFQLIVIIAVIMLVLYLFMNFINPSPIINSNTKFYLTK